MLAGVTYDRTYNFDDPAHAALLSLTKAVKNDIHFLPAGCQEDGRTQCRHSGGLCHSTDADSGHNKPRKLPAIPVADGTQSRTSNCRSHW